VLIVIDLCKCLELFDCEFGVELMVVVICVVGELISLFVDFIGDVVDVELKDFELLLDILVDGGCELVFGVYKFFGWFLLVFDFDCVVVV